MAWFGAQDWQRRLRFIAVGLCILAIAACVTVEPIRWRLPSRYLFKQLDIHRTGFGDYTMCLRAEMTPSEAQAFVNRSFAPEDHVAGPVPMSQTMCPAEFWPRSFRSQTMGLKIYYRPSGMIEGSRGAVYDRGHLYFWSNMM